MLFLCLNNDCLLFFIILGKPDERAPGRVH